MMTLLLIPVFCFMSQAVAHDPNDDGPPWLQVEKFDQADSFRQLEELLPTPTEARLASGAPGPRYWQQQVDHDIDVRIDSENHRLFGSETITYHNHSPHTLTYLWLQLDQNRFRDDGRGRLSETGGPGESEGFGWMRRISLQKEFEGGFNIRKVADASGNDLPHTIVETMMRIDLPEALGPGGTFIFSIDWDHYIVNADVIRARGGYEWFKETGNAIYEIAQWFPRLCAYTDVDGWHNKQFVGSGEFTLEFGDYQVRITAPDTFVVASTGMLQNGSDVLTDTQQTRFNESIDSDRPIFVITPEEAKENEKRVASGTKTWKYNAENVRDFAFAASPKFIWDSMGVAIEGKSERTLAMSYYPNEGEPLWSKYSTHAVAHTLECYSHFTIPYPYPVAISVNGPVGGMEYPMICFNGPRPEEDGTYSKRTKYGLIGVVIHEVGHNWFPMVINSDERQWTWMDEGLNTFVQFLTEQLWEEKYPARRGEARNISDFMTSERQVPIMTNSESLLQFGNNAYAKPATALNILRESILGRELFDFAFKEYAKRWAFHRPQPADLFRTLEDASGVDLDWFWRGWFYSTDHADVAIERVVEFSLEKGNPDIDKPARKEDRDGDPEWITRQRNKEISKRTERFPELLDFYNSFDELDVTEKDRRDYERFLEELEDDEAELLKTPWHFYVVRFRNFGGLVMPIPIEITYEDGHTEMVRIPAEVWRRNNRIAARMFVTEQPVTRFEVDPLFEIADADRSNNIFPPEMGRERFRLERDRDRDNPMRDAQEWREGKETEISARRFAKKLVEEIRADLSGFARPVRAVLRIAEEFPPELVTDPWGNRFELATSTGDPDRPEGQIAVLRSDGPDQEAATEDDIRFVIFKDGKIERKSGGSKKP